MNVGFITFDHDRRDKTGSARIRAYNLIKYDKDFHVFSSGPKYDAVVFQKNYWVEYAELFDGIKILDMCDPDWLSGSNAIQFRRMLNAVDGVVANTQVTADYIKMLTNKPVIVIPDRHDTDIFKEKKVHKGRAKSVVWFGYSHNATVLEMYIPKLEEMGLELTIVSEKHVSVCRNHREFREHEHFVKWPDSIEQVNLELVKHDFALLPRRRRVYEQYKSNNKVTQAWALGLPVAEWGDDIDKFIDAEARIEDQNLHFEQTKKNYNCKLSVIELRAFLDKIAKAKANGTATN